MCSRKLDRRAGCRADELPLRLFLMILRTHPPQYVLGETTSSPYSPATPKSLPVLRPAGAEHVQQSPLPVARGTHRQKEQRLAASDLHSSCHLPIRPVPELPGAAVHGYKRTPIYML